MIATTTVSPTRRLALCLLSMLCAGLIAAAFAAGAEVVINYQPESLTAYEQQLAAGQVKAVTINKRIRSLRVTLGNGTHVLVKYPPHEEAKYAAALASKKVAVTVLSPALAKKEAGKAPKHHKLRYIAAGVLILVLIIVGAVIYITRRRRALQD